MIESKFSFPPLTLVFNDSMIESKFPYVMKGIGGYTIFIIFLPYCTKYRVSRSCDYTETLLSMLSKQEVHTEHAQSAKCMHFLSKLYKSPTQGASFHRVTWLATANTQLHLADNSQVDRTPFVYFYYFYYKTAVCYTN